MRLMDTLLSFLGVHERDDWPGPAKASDGSLSRPSRVTLPRTLKTEPAQWLALRQIDERALPSRATTSTTAGADLRPER